jgi:hypothetical protein
MVVIAVADQNLLNLYSRWQCTYTHVTSRISEPQIELQKPDQNGGTLCVASAADSSPVAEARGSRGGAGAFFSVFSFFLLFLSFSFLFLFLFCFLFYL